MDGVGVCRKCWLGVMLSMEWWEALQKREWKCAVCGSTDELEVHHKKRFKDQPWLDYRASNLVILCKRCHLRVHGKKNFAERVRDGEVAKVYGRKVCPKCGQRGYGIVLVKPYRNASFLFKKFIHEYRTKDGVKKKTACYIGFVKVGEDRRGWRKGLKEEHLWVCSCGFKTPHKVDLNEHIIREHGAKRYSQVEKWVMVNCKHYVRYIKPDGSVFYASDLMRQGWLDVVK